MPRAKYKNDKNLEKIPEINSVMADKKCCIICKIGPLKRNERVDVASLDGREQMWCKKCYEIGCESADNYDNNDFLQSRFFL